MRPRLLITSALVGLSLIATALLPRVQAATDLLVKASGPAVYYIGVDNKRYVFPNQAIYNSWYRDFSAVQTISDSALASYPIGGTVFYRPGTRLIKITSDPKVYAVGVGGTLYPIASEAAAIRLYGKTWSNRVDDLSDAFFASYRTQGELDGSTHPVGTFFRYIENTSYYYLDLSGNDVVARPLAESLISQFRFEKANALALNSADFPYIIGPIVHADEGSLFLTAQPATNGSTPSTPTTPTQPGTPTSPSEGGTTAAITLSPFTALKPNQIIVKGDGAARLYAFTVDGDAATAVTIKRVTMTVYVDAGGTDPDFSAGFDSDDPAFWSVNQLMNSFTLRDATSGEVFDSESVLNPDGTVSFTTTITVAAKAKRSLELTANLTSVSANVRVSADLVPSTGLQLTSSASTTTAKPATGSLNGGISPSLIVLPAESGILTVESFNGFGDSVHALSESLVPYSLLFTADGEPFEVNSISLGFPVDGDDVYAIDHLSMTYKTNTGATETKEETFVDDEATLYRFINLHIYVPKGQTVTVPITMNAKADPMLYSGARISMKFDTTEFSARSQYTNTEYTRDLFADPTKLKNRTSAGPTVLYRQGLVRVVSSSDGPTGPITRYNKLPILSFSFAAESHEIKIHQLTFKIESSDIDEDGDDNDFFERVANTAANRVVGIALHNQNTVERRYLSPQSVTFKIYDASMSSFDETPDGLQTAPGDYGQFTITFGSSPITVPAGQTVQYDLDLDTTLMAFEKEQTVKARLLGDNKGTAASQANFLWSEGSAIQTTGYLVSGLDLIGPTIAVR